MAEAQYMPDTTDTAGLFLRSAEFGQNFMQRRQRMQWEQEDRTENQRVRQLFEPVMQAQRQAQVATALSSLETNKQQQQLRTRFAAEAPVYNKKYQAAMKLPTFAEQQAALAQLQPEITWMGLLPEGKGFVDTVNNSRALAFQSDMADRKIKGTITEIEARKLAIIEEIKLRAKEQRDTNAQRPVPKSADQILLQNLEDARARGDVEDIAYYTNKMNRAGRGYTTPEQQAAYYRNKAKEATMRGDTQQAKDLNALADKVTGQISGGGSDLPPGWEGIQETTVTAPAVGVPPNATQRTPAPAATTAPVSTQAVIDSIKF